MCSSYFCLIITEAKCFVFKPVSYTWHDTLSCCGIHDKWKEIPHYVFYSAEVYYSRVVAYVRLPISRFFLTAFALFFLHFYLLNCKHLGQPHLTHSTGGEKAPSQSKDRMKRMFLQRGLSPHSISANLYFHPLPHWRAAYMYCSNSPSLHAPILFFCMKRKLAKSNVFSCRETPFKGHCVIRFCHRRRFLYQEHTKVYVLLRYLPYTLRIVQ